MLWSVDNPGRQPTGPQTRVDSDDCTAPAGQLRGCTALPAGPLLDSRPRRRGVPGGPAAPEQPRRRRPRLEPHNYSMIDVPAKVSEECEPATPTCETDPTLCPVPPVECENIPGDQAYDDESGECVLIPEEPVLPPNTPEKPTKPTKPSAGPPTTLLTQAPVQPASGRGAVGPVGAAGHRCPGVAVAGAPRRRSGAGWCGADPPLAAPDRTTAPQQGPPSQFGGPCLPSGGSTAGPTVGWRRRAGWSGDAAPAGDRPRPSPSPTPRTASVTRP